MQQRTLTLLAHIMKHLHSIRRIIAILIFVPIVLFFVDFTGKLPIALHNLLSIQWIPALLSVNILVLLGLLTASLLFGRIYCSVICPLGIYQDLVSRLAQRFRKKKKRYSFSPSATILRYSILVASVLVFAVGNSALILLLDPYSTFGRIVSQCVRPVVLLINNGMASILNAHGNYSMYRIEQMPFLWSSFGIALLFLMVVSTMAAAKGRLYCNSICPVGSFLGLLSKISLFHIRFNPASCNHCTACEKQCKSQCIDSKAMIVDDSRCVSCFNCLSSCKKGGLKYTFRYATQTQAATVEPSNQSRRAFLLTSGLVITSLAFAGSKRIARKEDAILNRKPIMPPGAKNREHFGRHCTGCQLCITKCPMQVLQPAVLEYGLTGITQPHMKFSTHVFCTYECNICSSVCPTGALTKIDIPTKKRTQVGVANLRLNMCQVIEHNTDCGACAEHCPTQAVHMIPYKNGLTRPEVTPDLCIGCGGCESICPVKPYQAIYIEGVNTQQLAQKPAEAKKFNKKIDDFGF